MELYSVLNPKSLQKQDHRIHWANLTGASDSLAIAQLVKQPGQGQLLVIATDSQVARRLQREITFFLQESLLPCYVLPDGETLPYDYFSPHADLISERLSVLNHLLKVHKGIVIAAVSTLMHRFLPRKFLIQHSMSIAVGEFLDPQIFREQLTSAGYYSVKQVLEHGEFAVRGSIMDIFPMGSPLPFRMELFDDKVETIRKFNPETQCSIEKIDEIKLFPAREYPLTEESIDYFRQNWRSRFSGNPKDSAIYEHISEGLAAPGAEYYLSLFYPKLDTIFDYLILKHKLFAQPLWRILPINFGKMCNIDMSNYVTIFKDLYVNRKNYLSLRLNFLQTSKNLDKFNFIKRYYLKKWVIFLLQRINH